MLNIIRSDIYRIKKGPGIYIFAAVLIYIAISCAVRNSGFQLFYILIAVSIPSYIFIAKDISGGSIKNTLSSVTSRKKYFFSKLLLTEIFECISLIIADCIIWIVRLINMIIIIAPTTTAVNGYDISSIGMTNAPLSTLPLMIIRHLVIFIFITSLLNILSFFADKISTFIAVIVVINIVQNAIYDIIKAQDEYLPHENDYKSLLIYEINHILDTAADAPFGNPDTLNVSAVYLMLSASVILLGYIIFERAEIRKV